MRIEIGEEEKCCEKRTIEGGPFGGGMGPRDRTRENIRVVDKTQVASFRYNKSKMSTKNAVDPCTSKNETPSKIVKKMNVRYE